MLNMSEGVMTISFDGVVAYANPSALVILGFTEDELVGKKFAGLFFDREENDKFSQAILDAIYDREHPHDAIVPYTNGDTTRQLRVVTSFLQDNGEKIGIIVVFGDLSELMDLRDAVRSMEKIRALNEQLNMRNKLLNETFGRFLSDEIVRQLLDTPDGLNLGGSKRKLTIMMSDLRGFTAISERMDPEELITMLNHYLGEMTEIIQRHNGTIIEFMGDGIFAIFGAPVASDTHADDAVAAALEMQARMEPINAWNKEHGYTNLQMGIGINTGEVIVGNIGSERRTKYGVVGSDVNLCGRIESYTIDGQVLISQSTFDEAKAEIVIEKEIVVTPKGASQPMTLRRATGIGEPYNIYVQDKVEEAPKKLDRIIPVTYYRIEGKHNLQKPFFGGIVALAPDKAVLDTSAELKEYDNITIDVGEKLYSKVIEKTEDGFLIGFTSVPASYKHWLEVNKK